MIQVLNQKGKKYEQKVRKILKQKTKKTKAKAKTMN